MGWRLSISGFNNLAKKKDDTYEKYKWNMNYRPKDSIAAQSKKNMIQSKGKQSNDVSKIANVSWGSFYFSID